PLVQYLPPTVRRISTISPTDIEGRTTLDELIENAPKGHLRAPEREGLLIVLTSGTTGTPKRAKRATPAGSISIAAMLSVLRLRAEDTPLTPGAILRPCGLGALQISTPLRATVVLQDRVDPEKGLQAIDEHRVTALMAVPIMLQRILNLPAKVRAKYDTSSV